MTYHEALCAARRVVREWRRDCGPNGEVGYVSAPRSIWDRRNLRAHFTALEYDVAREIYRAANAPREIA